MAEEEKTTVAAEQEEDARLVALVSQEGDSFNVSLDVAQMSELVKTMIDGERGALLRHTPNTCCFSAPFPRAFPEATPLPASSPRFYLVWPNPRTAPARSQTSRTTRTRHRRSRFRT